MKKMMMFLLGIMFAATLIAQPPNPPPRGSGCPVLEMAGTRIVGSYDFTDGEAVFINVPMLWDYNDATLSWNVPNLSLNKLTTNAIAQSIPAITYPNITDTFWLVSPWTEGIARYDIKLTKTGCPDSKGKLFVTITP